MDGFATATTITIRHDAQPDSRRNFRFEGDLGDFKLDDPREDDGDDYTNAITFTVEPGLYRVEERLASRWHLTAITCNAPDSGVADLAEHSVAMRVLAGQQVACTFTNQYSGAVKARVYQDRNGDGVRDHEPGLKNWAITLYDAAGAVVEQRNTSGAGKAHFWALRPSAYTVCEIVPAGWFNSQPGALFPEFSNQPCYGLAIAPGQEWTLAFGNHDGADLISGAGGGATAGPSVVTVVDNRDEVGDADDGLFADEDEETPTLEERVYLPVIEG